MRKLDSIARLLLALASLVANCSIVFAQGEVEDTPEQLYRKSESMIPMRDSVKLYTEIYFPKKGDDLKPIILLRTPYGVADAGGGFTRYFCGISASPSYCIIPAYLTFGLGPRGNLSNSSSSKAILISMARSPLKLKKMTLSLSSMGPRGALLRPITNGGRS